MPASTRQAGAPPAALGVAVAVLMALSPCAAEGAAKDVARGEAVVDAARVAHARPVVGRVRRVAGRAGLRFALRDARGRDRRLLARGAHARRLARVAGRWVTVRGRVVRLGPRRRGMRVLVVRSLRLRSARRPSPAPTPQGPAPAPSGSQAPPPLLVVPPAPPPAALPPPPPVPGPHLWSGDFETGDLSQWRTRGGGTGLQSVSDDRIRVVRSPVAQGAYSARFEVRRGDAWRGSGGNRAELMHWTGEGEGDERWYSWSTMFPPDFPRVTTGYQIVTQWHAEKPGTQPPITVYASGDRIGFRTTEANADGSSSPSVVHWSGPMSRGAWHRFLLRVRWSARREGGWVEMWHDGVRVVPRTPARTMVPGQAIYLKQGLYRSESIAPVGVVYHDGMAMHAR